MSDLPHILVVGSESSGLPEVADQAREKKIEVHQAGSALEALKILSRTRLDLVLVQARLPDASGLKVVRRARSLGSPPDVLVVGPSVSPSRRTDILASGAEDYIEMPVSTQDLLARVEQTLSARRMALETGLTGRSPKMLQVFETIKQVAPTRITVLIVGESGTGKEVAARAIHNLNPQRHGPFVAVNCAAIPEGLLESELFGHERGAFTGATDRHRGRFEQAEGGTLFLDEIGETPPAIQVKLLRVLEEHAFYRVGGNKPIQADVRLVAATNANLEETVARGTFRRDLYFRLRVVTLALPPLRERREDIPLLVDQFLTEAAARHGSPVKRVPPETMHLLTESRWPGNVRELQNLIESLSVLVQSDRIEPDDVRERMTHQGEVYENLPVSIGPTKEDAEREILFRNLMAVRSELAELKSIILGALQPSGVMPGSGEEPIRGGGEDRETVDSGTLSQVEDRMITEALRKTGGNRRRAAELLGISERTLYRKLKRQRTRDPDSPDT